MELVQKELTCKEEFENSQSSSKIEVSSESMSCSLDCFQSKVMNNTSTFDTMNESSSAIDDLTIEEQSTLENQVSSDYQDSTRLKGKTEIEDADNTMDVDILSDIIPVKESNLKDIEVESSTLDMSIEVNNNKNEETTDNINIQNNNKNKNEEKSYHSVLKNSEELSALELNLMQLSTVKKLTLRKYHKNNSSIAKIDSLLALNPTRPLEKFDKKSLKPFEAFKKKFEPAYSFDWDKISFSELAPSTSQHHNLKIIENLVGDVEIKQEESNGNEKWNEKEKSSFVDLLKEFNEVRPVSEQCMQIAFKLKTKTASQVRSYLQKHYQRLQQEGVKTPGVPVKFHRYATKPTMSAKKRSLCDTPPIIFGSPKSAKLSTKTPKEPLSSNKLDYFENLSCPQREKLKPLSPQEIDELRGLEVIDERALDNYLKMVEVYRRREEQMEVRRKEMMESEMRGVKGEMEEQETFFSHNFDAMCTNCSKGPIFGHKFTCADCISLHNISFYLCANCMKPVNDGNERVRNQPQHSDEWHKFSIVSAFVNFQPPTPIGDYVHVLNR